MAEIGGPRIWFDSDLYQGALQRRRDRLIQQNYRQQFCFVGVHELGHTAGFDNEDPRFPIMNATAAIPSACRKAFPIPRSER